MKKLLFISLMVLTACSKYETDNYTNGQPPKPVPPVVQVPDPVLTIVSEYNEQRQALGQELVSQGLTCSLYTVPNTTTAIIGATLTSQGQWEYSGNFNQSNTSSSPGLNVLPVVLQPLYNAWYVVKCSGLLVVPNSGFYSFSVSSDDGANLYVNGLLINNDGVHGVSTKSAAKYLARGMVSFELDYFDQGGNKALVLNMDGNLLPASNFYH